MRFCHTTARVLLLLVLAMLAGALYGSPALSAARPVPDGSVVASSSATLARMPGDAIDTGAIGTTAAPAPDAAAPALTIQDLQLTQGVFGEPLILGKATAARVRVTLPADARVDAELQVEVAGKPFTRTVTLAGQVVTVTLPVNLPGEVKPVTATASLRPIDSSGAQSPAVSSPVVTFQTVRTTEKVVAFFLPVDWTPDERSAYNYDTAFKNHVQEVEGFLRGAYPLPADRVIVDYTMTPHMLGTFEKTLADSQGKFNMRNALALYANLSVAGRRYRPDATMVVGVLPPNWFRKHGQPGTVGFALSDVKGIVTGQYADDLPPIIAAHEIGHMYWLDEDYDFAVKPARPCYSIAVTGFWVQRDEELANTANRPLCTFMSAASSQDAYWVDPIIYDYLLGKFTIPNGSASAPMILAATMTWRVEPEGFPGRTSANVRRFEPNQPVYVSVAGMALQANSTIEARLVSGGGVVTSVTKQTTAGNGWYSFRLADGNQLREDTYRAEIYLDGKAAKSNPFEVRASR